jgi:streptogramin lyase
LVFKARAKRNLRRVAFAGAALALWLFAGAGESAYAVTITDFGGLTPGSYPIGITAGPDGNVWFTEFSGPAYVGRVTPAGDVTEFPSGGSQIEDITSGPDGNRLAHWKRAITRRRRR